MGELPPNIIEDNYLLDTTKIKDILDKWLSDLNESRQSNFEYNKNVKINVVDKPEWDELYDMESMYRDNYKNKPKLMTYLINKLKDEAFLSNGNFFILNYGGSNIAFLKISRGIDGVLDLSCVNVNNLIHKNGVGGAFVKMVIDMLSKDFVINANCSAVDYQLSFYIENLGFIGNNIFTFEDELSINISLDKKNLLKSKSLSKDEIICLFESSTLSDDIIVESFDSQEKMNINHFNNGYLLSRYFKDTASGKWYAVFERLV